MSVPIFLLALALASAPVPSPHTPITPGSLAPAPAMRSPAESRRLARHADRVATSGSAVLIASCAAWGFMLTGLFYGAQQRRRYNGLITAINADDRPPGSGEQDTLAYYDQQGSQSNTNAIVSAIVGTTLTIVGAALLGRGLALKRRQGRRAPLGLAWHPGI